MWTTRRAGGLCLSSGSAWKRNKIHVKCKWDILFRLLKCYTKRFIQYVYWGYQPYKTPCLSLNMIIMIVSYSNASFILTCQDVIRLDLWRNYIDRKFYHCKINESAPKIWFAFCFKERIAWRDVIWILSKHHTCTSSRPLIPSNTSRSRSCAPIVGHWTNAWRSTSAIFFSRSWFQNK